MSYTREQIEAAVKAKGFKYFNSASDYDVNIVGIRTKGNQVTNSFNDYITISFRVKGVWQFYCWPCTTDPGTKSMQHFENIKGCARLVPGQYRASYTIRKHQDKYDAVCQYGPVKVYRDKNKDATYDENTIDEGMFGINIHKAGEDSTFVDGWSAGCQVFKRVKDFNAFMKICQEAAKVHGNHFTYTLLKQEDII